QQRLHAHLYTVSRSTRQYSRNVSEPRLVTERLKRLRMRTPGRAANSMDLFELRQAHVHRCRVQSHISSPYAAPREQRGREQVGVCPTDSFAPERTLFDHVQDFVIAG